jgi:hypothetical protein
MLRLLVDYEANALVYYVLVYPVTLADSGLAPLRAVSAVAGVLAIPALWWAARPLVGRPALLAACAALSLNAHAVTQSQNARPYAMVTLASILAYGFLVRACAGEDGRRNWPLYVVAVTVAVYLNALCGALLLAAQIAVPLARGRAAVRGWIVAVAAIAVASAPLAVLAAQAASDRDPFYWVTRPGIFDLAVAQVRLLGGPLAAVCAVAVLAAGLVHGRRAIPRGIRALVAHPATAVAAWAFAPIVVLFALSLVKPVFSDTYLAVSVPGLCLALALAATSLPRRAAAAALAVVLVSLAVGVADQTRRQYREDWRTPVHELSRLRAPGDPVLFDTVVGLVPAGYYDRALTSDGRLYVSQWHDAPMPPGVTALQSPGGYFAVPDGPPTVPLVRRLAARTGRLFVIVSHTSDQGDVVHGEAVRWLDAHCRTELKRSKAVDLVVASGCRS